MRRLMFALLSLGAMSLLCVSPAFSQDPPTISQGTLPTATYLGSDYEFVDTATFRVDLHIPLVSDKSQRGNLNFNYVVSSSGMGDWWPDCSWYGEYEYICNWEASSAETGVPDGPMPVMDGALQGVSDDSGDLLISEANGQAHMTAVNSAAGSFSMDGTGLQATYDSFGNSPIITKAGVQFFNNFEGTKNAKVQDSNGNYLGITSGAIFGTGNLGGEYQFAPGAAWTMTDTSNRSWTLSVGDPSTQCPAITDAISSTYAEVWTIPGVNSSTRTFIFCYRTPGAHTNFPDAAGATTTYNLGGPEEPELTDVILPDGTSWQFHYDDEDPSATYYFGDMTKLVLPTGGNITYTWTTENSSCVAGDLLRQLTTRTTPDGEWMYSASTYGGNTVTDPTGNDTVYSTGPSCGQISETDFYSGTGGSRSMVKKVINQYQSWQGPLPNWCVPTQLPTNTLTEYVVGGGFLGSEVDNSYDSGFTTSCYDVYGTYYGNFQVYYGLVIQQANYNFDASPPTKGTLLSVTNTSYKALATSSYLTANLLNLVSSQTVTDALTSGNLCSETDYSYDGTSPTSSGVSEHRNSVTWPRGNLTSITRQLFTSPCSTSGPSKTPLTTTNTIYDTGMLYTSTDPNSNTTTYSYSDYGSYVTTVTNALSQSTSYGYDSNTGLMTSMTDPNSQTTDYSYDCMLRPNEIGYPDGGEETWTAKYDTGYGCSGAVYEGSRYTKKIDSSQTFIRYETDDSQGRPEQTSSTVPSAMCSSGYTYVDTTYDGDGRKHAVSNPYCTTGDPTYGVTTDSYDALGEVTQVQEQDGQSITTTYGGDSSLQAYCSTVTGESGAKTKSCLNGVGWLTKVFEDPDHADYETDYGYTPNGDLNWVDENGSRTRSFAYDSLSRLTASVTPETGATCYGFYSGSTCAGNGYDAAGNLLYKTDSRGIVTANYYDTLNRLTYSSYSDGSPLVGYQYDLTSWSAISLSNTKGRLAVAFTYNGSIYTTAETFSYDSMGRPNMNINCRPAGCIEPNYTYNVSGGITSYDFQPLTYSGTAVTFGQSIDVDGRVTGISSSLSDSNHPSTLVSGLYYSPLGNLAQMTYVNGVVENQLYSPRMQPCRINFQTATSSVTGCTGSAPTGNLEDFQYGYGTYNNGSVRSWNATGTSSTPTFNRGYTYDWLNRLSTMSSPSDPSGCTGLSWSYDAWGNITGQSVTGGSCGTSSLTYNSANQITTSGFTYDAAGNLTADGSHYYYYDAENHLIQVDGSSGYCSTGTGTAATACYLYDYQGRRTQKIVGSTATDYFYDVAGHPIVEVNDGTGAWQTGYIYLGDQLVAEYTGGSSGTTEFVLGNQLGSSSLVTDLSGSVIDCNDFQPFGEQLPYTSCSNTNDTTHKFTGKERDPETAPYTMPLDGLDNFGARYYSSLQGRFMSPDPSGIAFANLTDPQQLNLYSYVRNNPLSLVDPHGYDCVYLNNAGTDVDTDADGNPTGIDTNSNSQECGTNGGYWVNGSLTALGLYTNSNDVDLEGKDANGPTSANYDFVDGSNPDPIAALYSYYGAVKANAIAQANGTQAEQGRMRALAAAGSQASHDLACAAGGMGSMIPFVGAFVGAPGASTGMMMGSAATSVPSEVQIIGAENIGKGLNAIEMPNIGELAAEAGPAVDALAKDYPAALAGVGAVSGFVQANACFNRH